VAGEPVTIVEVGAGTGRLAFLVLRELMEAAERWPAALCAPTTPSAPGVAPVRAPFRWVLTDIAEESTAYWRGHEALAPYFDAGLASAAVFDAEHDSRLVLVGSGTVLEAGSLANPMVIVSNYIFDTLRQDAFRVVEGQLQEALATLYSSRPEDAPAVAAGAPPHDLIRHLRVGWSYRPVTPADAFPADPHLQTALAVLAARLPNSSHNIPVGGIDAVNRLLPLARGRGMLLAGDKAYNHAEELVGVRDPHVAVHGSFSFMVNFHALRVYALARGGFALQTPLVDGFKCSAFMFGLRHDGAAAAAGGPSSSAAAAAAAAAAAPAAAAAAVPLVPAAEVMALVDVAVTDAALAYPELLCAWADCMDTFGPDNFAALQRCVRDELPRPSLKTALATLRMSCWDADVFYKFKAVFIEGTPAAPAKLQADIARDAQAVGARYFPLQASKDVSFELGRVHMGLRAYRNAIALFHASMRQCGEHHVTWYNIGICHWYLDEWTESQITFNTALTLRPDYTDAASWRDRVDAKIQGLAFLRTAAAAADAAAATAAGVPPPAAALDGSHAAEPPADVVAHADGDRL